MKIITTLILTTLLNICLYSQYNDIDWNTQDNCYHQIIKYYDGGSIKEVGCYNEALERTGSWHLFSPEGNKIALVSFDNHGNKHGDWKIWSDSGDLKAHMKYNHGKRSGTWVAILEDGTIQEKKYTTNE